MCQSLFVGEFMENIIHQCVFRQLGLQHYQPVWKAMQDFTLNRNENTSDEIWFVEHYPVFTQGQAGKQEHLLSLGDIPLVQVDRGGQVTYHGPGQQIVYFLIDLKRKKLGVRQLVALIEKAVIELLSTFNIDATVKDKAPGVYVDEKKICSLGLKIKRSCSFHGLALNINMNIEPFLRINPCGYKGLKIIQTADLGGPKNLSAIENDFKNIILTQLNYTSFNERDALVF